MLFYEMYVVDGKCNIHFIDVIDILSQASPGYKILLWVPNFEYYVKLYTLEDIEKKKKKYEKTFSIFFYAMRHYLLFEGIKLILIGKRDKV